MLIELNYVLLSVLLVAYSSWRYFRGRQKAMIYAALAFTFLTFSALLQAFVSSWWIMIRLKIPHQYVELTSLAFFACFAITAIITLAKTPKTSPQTQQR